MKITSLAGVGASAVESKATAVVPHLTSEIANKISAALPVATSLLNNAGSLLSGLGLKERADAGDILEEVGTVAACIANAVSTNTLFIIGECAKDLATLVVPVAELSNLKEFTGVAGGVGKVVEALKASRSVGDVVRNGGSAMVDLLKGVSAVKDTVKTVGFWWGRIELVLMVCVPLRMVCFVFLRI